MNPLLTRRQLVQRGAAGATMLSLPGLLAACGGSDGDGSSEELKDVVNTPNAIIGFTLLQGGRRAVVTSVIDNLLKGAASQAVQNFNRMQGYAETEGLL